MEEGDAGVSGPLFQGVAVAVIPSDALSLGHTIIDNGGRVVKLGDSTNEIEDISTVTHIISADIHFAQYNEAIARGVLVVKPSWFTQSYAKGKVAGARQHSPDPSQYFQDVVVSCAELPEGDKDAIIAGVIALGGQYQASLTKITTHMVTTDFQHPKCQMAVQKKAHCRIVLPHWFDDCLKLGKKISERPYLYPNPPYLQHNLPRPANSQAPGVEGATAAMPTTPLMNTPPSSPSDTRKNLNAFMSKKVRLGADLGLSEHLIRTLKELINHGGGTLTDNVEEADIYVGQYRDGLDYVTAARAHKEVANLSWLYHVINENRYFNPISKLLHYPIPRDGIPGFQNMRISISNYNGDARTYLENLIRYCGAEFTKTMKQDNTHLIAAHTRSEKFEAAQEWNINIINHVWLEESYAKCTVQPLTNPKYTHFPASTNLSEVVGQTGLDMRRVEQVFFPAPRESPQKTQLQVKSKPSPQKAVPASSATVSVVTPRKASTLTAPTPIAEDAETDDGEAGQASPSAKKPRGRPSKQAGTPRATNTALDDDQSVAPQTAPRSRGRPRKSLATPARLDDEKENESPMVSTGGRAAKIKAAENIHGYAPDMALYEKEKKRKGGVTHGGRRGSNADAVSSPVPEEPKRTRKRKSDEATYDVTAEGSDLSDGETQAKTAKGAKKARTSGDGATLPPVEYRMMVTGDDRWLSNPKKEDTDKTKLRMLGVHLTQDPLEVDILVAPNIKRTRKFVAAIANAPLVVDTKYLDAALKQDKLLEDPSLLQDRKAEATYDFKLSESLDRAKINKHKLLDGWSIFVTKDIPGGFDTYKEIITVNGGEAFLYQGRTGLSIPKRQPRSLPSNSTSIEQELADVDEEELSYVYLVTGSTEPEIKLWKTFRAQAAKQDLKARVVKSDWLLTSMIVQEVRWDSKWEYDEAAVLSQRDR